MNTRLTTLATKAAQAVAPLKETIRRGTCWTHPEDDEAERQAFLAAVEVKDSCWDEWQATTFDVRFRSSTSLPMSS